MTAINVVATPEDAALVFSEAFEEKWLGIIGPSAWIMVRKLARAGVMGKPVDLDTLALSMGLGRGTGKQSPVARTFNRLVQFGMVRIDADQGLVVTPRPVRQAA